MMTPVFETPRLCFRRFEPGDLDALARIAADAETSRYVGDGRPLTREETETWIKNSRRNVARFGYGTGAVIERASGLLVGWAGIARPGDGTEEVIYGFHRDHWGQGVGAELLEGLVRWARDDLHLPELRATVDRRNTASIALLKRRGFRLVDECDRGDPEVLVFVTEFGCGEP